MKLESVAAIWIILVFQAGVRKTAATSVEEFLILHLKPAGWSVYSWRKRITL